MAVNPTYYDMAFHLDANGFGTLGSDLFGGEWGSADRQTLVIEGPAIISELKELYESPGVQILVRGEKRDTDLEVYRTAKAISDYLLSLPDSVDINGTCYTGFEETTNLAALGKDENERFVYSMNFSTNRNRL